jgi:predicted lipoprotein with Yx(FWY)xxD motif
MRRAPRLLALGLAAALAVAGISTATVTEGRYVASGSTDAAAAKPLVKKLKTQAFGNVLVTRGNRALYYWTPEKRNPGKIVCTGQCARAWPPLIVPKGVQVPRKLAGFKGTFGTIKRPDGRRQLTYNRLPLYTYAHEGPGQVLCNDVDGWFVVRV